MQSGVKNSLAMLIIKAWSVYPAHLTFAVLSNAQYLWLRAGAMRTYTTSNGHAVLSDGLARLLPHGVS